MKKITYAALAAGVVFAAGQAGASELWNQHLRGSDIGGALGALPPAGVYFVDDNYYGAFSLDNDKSQSSQLKLDVYVNIPILLWSTGIKILGADYAVGIAQPFDYTNLNYAADSDHWGTFNTVLIPAALSWTLGDFRVKGQLAIAVDDASSSPSSLPARGGAGSGNAYNTFEPSIGASYLKDGWNASVALRYDTSTADDSHYVSATKNEKYQSGDQISTDWTFTKALGKWTVGAGAYTQSQIERDQINGVSTAGTSRVNAGAGPIVGYQFGGIGVTANYDHQILNHNDFGGDVFQVRFVVPLY